jgi:hypothetical protein
MEHRRIILCFLWSFLIGVDVGAHKHPTYSILNCSASLCIHLGSNVKYDFNAMYINLRLASSCDRCIDVGAFEI